MDPALRAEIEDLLREESAGGGGTFLRGHGVLFARFEDCTIKGRIETLGEGLDARSQVVFARCSFEADGQGAQVDMRTRSFVRFDSCSFVGVRPLEWKDDDA